MFVARHTFLQIKLFSSGCLRRKNWNHRFKAASKNLQSIEVIGILERNLWVGIAACKGNRGYKIADDADHGLGE